MSFLNGFPRFFDGFPTFAFGFLLSATPFYFPRRFAAFRKGFLIFRKGFPIFLDGFPLSKKSEKIYLRRQVYERLLFELRNSSPLCSLSFVIATRSSSVIIATMPTSLQLYPNSVFRYGIGWYFLGIFLTNTEGKLGKDLRYRTFGGNPFFPRYQSPPLEGSSRKISQKGAPAKSYSTKNTVHTVPNIPTSKCR